LKNKFSIVCVGCDKTAVRRANGHAFIECLAQMESDSTVPLTLVPDADNKYDRSAIKVLFKDLELGYVKASQTLELHEEFDFDKQADWHIRTITRNNDPRKTLAYFEIYTAS
jgi:hypothetical protein